MGGNSDIRLQLTKAGKFIDDTVNITTMSDLPTTKHMNLYDQVTYVYNLATSQQNNSDISFFNRT